MLAAVTAPLTQPKGAAITQPAEWVYTIAWLVALAYSLIYVRSIHPPKWTWLLAALLVVLGTLVVFTVWSDVNTPPTCGRC